MTPVEIANEVVQVVAYPGPEDYARVKVGSDDGEPWELVGIAHERAEAYRRACVLAVEKALALPLPALMSEEEVAEIKRRYDLTTHSEGKWHVNEVEGHNIYVYLGTPGTKRVIVYLDGTPGRQEIYYPQAVQNAYFIACAHQAIPSLLAERATLLRLLAEFEDGLPAAYRAGHADGAEAMRKAALEAVEPILVENFSTWQSDVSGREEVVKAIREVRI